MHASPPFQMAVHRYGVWRAAAVLLVASTTAAVAAWLVHSHVMTLVWAVLCLLVSGSVAVLAHAWRLRPVSLRWDSQRWHLGPLPTTGHEPDAGRLVVAMDFGAWMLLRFIPDSATVLRPGVWLPVQRLGHEPAWHSLRCTVYCARPVSLPAVAPF
jgi:uncharacterized membrane protein